jgi:hypothetical protein
MPVVPRHKGALRRPAPARRHALLSVLATLGVVLTLIVGGYAAAKPANSSWMPGHQDHRGHHHHKPTKKPTPRPTHTATPTPTASGTPTHTATGTPTTPPRPPAPPPPPPPPPPSPPPPPPPAAAP